MASSLRPPSPSSTAPPREERPSQRPSGPSSIAPPREERASQRPSGLSSIAPPPEERPREEPASQRPGIPSQRPGSLRPSFGISDIPVVHEGAPGAFFGSWKNVFIANWRSQGTVLGIDRMLGAIAAMPHIAEKRSDIHIIAEGARLPEAGVRDHFIEAIKASSDSLATVAVVVGGGGFWASTIRSFVTGLHWVAPRSFDFRLHASIGDVAEWLPPLHEARSGVRLDPARLRRILEEWTAQSNGGQR